MLTTDEKRRYFNEYWQTRDIPSADARSVQRAEYVRMLLDASTGRKLLDVGCGRGMVLKYLAGQGYAVSGCDLSSDTVTLLKEEGYDAFLCDIERDPLPGEYDTILCLETLQQVFDPAMVLRKMAGVVGADGVIIVSVPNEFHLLARLRMLAGRSHLGHFDHSHIRLFCPRRARELFERSGLEVEKSVSVSVVPPRFTMLNRIGAWVAHIAPGLFSLSQIYKLRVR